MANFVIKKDGTKQPFEVGKIRRSIEMAAKQAGLPDEKVNELVEKVSLTVLQMAGEKEEIRTTELRDKILAELDELEPSVSASWREYDEEKGK